MKLNVLENIRQRFHVELLKQAVTDLFPNKTRNHAPNMPTIDELDIPEYEIESFLRARAVRRGQEIFRQVLVKWVRELDPTWEPIDCSVSETNRAEKHKIGYD